MWILAWQDPETQSFLQLIINWSKSIPNWLLNGKSSYFDPEPTHKVHWGQVPASSRACLCSAWAGKTTWALLKAVQQVNYDFFSKPCGPKTTILSCSANPWQQKRTAFTNEVICWLLRTRNKQNCSKKTTYFNRLYASFKELWVWPKLKKRSVEVSNKTIQYNFRTS